MDKKEEIERLKNKLLIATGKYSDYQSYVYTLDDLVEKYDETLEEYNWEIWQGQSVGTIRQKASYMLSVTQRLFEDMKENAKKELLSVLEEIAEHEQNDQQQIWGKDIFIDRDKLKQDEVQEILFVWEEQPYVQQEALEYFVSLVESIE